MFNLVVLTSTGILFAISGFMPIEYMLLMCVTTLLIGVPLIFQLDRSLKNPEVSEQQIPIEEPEEL